MSWYTRMCPLTIAGDGYWSQTSLTFFQISSLSAIFQTELLFRTNIWRLDMTRNTVRSLLLKSGEFANCGSHPHPLDLQYASQNLSNPSSFFYLGGPELSPLNIGLYPPYSPSSSTRFSVDGKTSCSKRYQRENFGLYVPPIDDPVTFQSTRYKSPASRTTGTLYFLVVQLNLLT